MSKIVLPKNICQDLENLAEDRKIYLEGNLIKVIEPDPEYPEFNEYLTKVLDRDTKTRRNRMDIHEQFQKQTTELKNKEAVNDALMEDLKGALKKAENAKKKAENDLDYMQKKKQFELIGNIVNFALYIIGGVGICVTLMYLGAIILDSGEVVIIGSTWSNMFGILLTNSFSIIGTIMGVKYATENATKPKDNTNHYQKPQAYGRDPYLDCPPCPNCDMGMDMNMGPSGPGGDLSA